MQLPPLTSQLLGEIVFWIRSTSTCPLSAGPFCCPLAGPPEPPPPAGTPTWAIGLGSPVAATDFTFGSALVVSALAESPLPGALSLAIRLPICVLSWSSRARTVVRRFSRVERASRVSCCSSQ